MLIENNLRSVSYNKVTRGFYRHSVNSCTHIAQLYRYSIFWFINVQFKNDVSLVILVACKIFNILHNRQDILKLWLENSQSPNCTLKNVAKRTYKQYLPYEQWAKLSSFLGNIIFLFWQGHLLFWARLSSFSVYWNVIQPLSTIMLLFLYIYVYFCKCSTILCKIILSVAQYLYHKVFRLGHQI